MIAPVVETRAGLYCTLLRLLPITQLNRHLVKHVQCVTRREEVGPGWKTVLTDRASHIVQVIRIIPSCLAVSVPAEASTIVSLLVSFSEDGVHRDRLTSMYSRIWLLVWQESCTLRPVVHKRVIIGQATSSCNIACNNPQRNYSQLFYSRSTHRTDSFLLPPSISLSRFLSVLY
jgi:hypothetical protein